MSDKLTPAQMREINDTIRYSMWSVFSSVTPLGGDREELVAELETGGTTRKDAILDVARRAGVPKREVYDAVHKPAPQGEKP